MGFLQCYIHLQIVFISSSDISVLLSLSVSRESWKGILKALFSPLFSGMVYNVTPYMDYHPGGEEELMKAAGIDGTDLFDQVWKLMGRSKAPSFSCFFLKPNILHF